MTGRQSSNMGTLNVNLGSVLGMECPHDWLPGSRHTFLCGALDVRRQNIEPPDQFNSAFRRSDRWPPLPSGGFVSENAYPFNSVTYRWPTQLTR